MKKAIWIMALAAALPMTVAHAEEAATASERVEHYEAKALSDAAQAKATFKEELKEIATTMAHETLDGALLELVHERTYTMEEAVKVMRESQGADDALLHQLAVAVEVLHESAEQHAEPETRQAYARLQGLAQKL